MKQPSPASFLAYYCDVLATMKTGLMLKFRYKTTIIDEVLIQLVQPSKKESYSMPQEVA
jgi:hypothetical protein